MTEMTDSITVRYFAGARAATGIDQEDLDLTQPWSLDELAELLGQRHGPALARILLAASFLVDETTSTRERVVTTGSVVDVLPPFAGG
jgi:molybdopterin synthase sulfur carrier subunit